MLLPWRMLKLTSPTCNHNLAGDGTVCCTRRHKILTRLHPQSVAQLADVSKDSYGINIPKLFRVNYDHFHENQMNILRLALGDSKFEKGGRKRKSSCTPSYITGNRCLKMKLSQVEAHASNPSIRGRQRQVVLCG